MATRRKSVPSLAQSLVVNFPFEDTAIPKNSDPNVLAASPLKKPFELMKIICKTVTAGAYLTESVYIPKLVWYQEGAVSGLPCVQGKMRYLEEVEKELHALRKVPKAKAVAVQEAVRKFNHTLDHISSAHLKDVLASKPLSKAMKEKSKVEQTINKLFEKAGAKIFANSRRGDDAYVPLLLSVLTELLFLEEWVEFYEVNPSEHQQCFDLLQDLTTHLMDVLCAFLLSDMVSLLDKYMHGARKEVCHGIQKEKWKETFGVSAGTPLPLASGRKSPVSPALLPVINVADTQPNPPPQKNASYE